MMMIKCFDEESFHSFFLSFALFIIVVNKNSNNHNNVHHTQVIKDSFKLVSYA